MNKIRRRKCIVCKKPFEYNTTKIHKKSDKFYRGRRMITCSKDCSKTLNRIESYLRNLWNRKETIK